jgi:hypothetical protein
LEGIDLKTGVSIDNPPERKLLYIRPLQEAYVQIHALNPDPTNPRFGQPEVYQCRFLNSIIGNQNMISVRVHWTRIIHLCDNRLDSNVFGEPRMKNVYNRMLDLQKVCGGSAEMFWKGGFPGLSLETQPGLPDDIEIDEKKTREQMEEYQAGLKRYLMMVGMSAKSLSVEVADPEKHIDAQLKLIATAMTVPWRVFVGSEQGKLASTQDAATWNRRLSRRREDYINPHIIRNVVDRLIAIGVLPKPQENEGRYLIDWEDIAAPSDLEKAQVAAQRSQALFQYVTGGCDTIIPPFHYLHDILGLDEDEANAVLDAAQKQIDNDGSDNPLHPENDPHNPDNPNNAPDIPPTGAFKLGMAQVAPFAPSVGPDMKKIGVGAPVPNPKDDTKLKPSRFPPTGASPQSGPAGVKAGNTGP